MSADKGVRAGNSGFLVFNRVYKFLKQWRAILLLIQRGSALRALDHSQGMEVPRGRRARDVPKHNSLPHDTLSGFAPLYTSRSRNLEAKLND